jgi:4-hydroxybutyrate CoA-transferase
MDWYGEGTEYAGFERYTTPVEEAVSLVRDGDYVVTGMVEAKELLDALAARTDLNGVGVYCSQSLCGRIGDVALNRKSDITVYSSFIDPAESLMKAHKLGLIEFIPASFSSWLHVNRDHRRCSVLMLTVTPPDARGYMTCMSYPEQVYDLIQTAHVVLGEINDTLPTTYGSPPLHVSQFTRLVYAKSKWSFLVKAPMGDAGDDPAALRMSGYLSELIEDGATLECGVGAMNGKALLNLEGVKDLGIHTEYFGDVMMGLMERGIVNNSRKNIDRGVSIATIGSGSESFYRFIHKNPAVRFLPASYVMDLRMILKNPKVTAVNNAAEVDLLGQVNGEYIRGMQYSGIGGQGDFAKAATVAGDGKSIIALSSATADGKHSKIVAGFAPGTPVTTPRTDVEYIVTEYGIAQMVGQTVMERAKNLIRVAHPNFRDGLEEEAKRAGLLR